MFILCNNPFLSWIILAWITDKMVTCTNNYNDDDDDNYFSHHGVLYNSKFINITYQTIKTVMQKHALITTK